MAIKTAAPLVPHAQEHPWRDFLHRLEKPARYTGGEFQSVRKPWDSADVRYALCFPDVYDIGMSHLGTKILYKLVNDLPWALGERCFAPWIDAGAELRARGLPLVSLESWQPLAAFDVLGFSLQYELTFTNVLEMLHLGGVPVRNADRDESHPLVIAGGPSSTHPEPMTPFIDAFVIGDGEEILPLMLEVVRRAKAEGWSRRATLLAWAALGGVYCPDLYTRGVRDDGGFEVVTAAEPGAPLPIVRRLLDDIDRFPFPDDAPVAAAEAIFDRMSIEIARGCTEGCRFCQAGMIYRPVRERSPTEVVRTVLSAVDKAGYDEVSLTTLSTADYSCISPLVKEVAKELKARNASLSVASLRAYGLAEDLLDDIGSIRASSLTFAPEAGSQRMRDVINKNVSEQDLNTTAHRVFSRNWRKVKCYFILGLPTEEDEDVIEIAEMSRRMLEIGRIYKRDAAVTVSVSSHVPKPHTPFQWAAMDSLEEIERKQQILFTLTRRYGLAFRRHESRGSVLEGVIGRGDRRVGEAIFLAWQAGARFDGWDDQLQFESWVNAFAQAGIDTERYLGRIREDAALPWDHIDVGLAEGFLAREWKRSLKDRLSPPCGKPVGMQVHHTNVAEAVQDQRKLVCYHCGVACDLDKMRTERVAFLQSLGAMAPLQPAAEVATTGPDSLEPDATDAAGAAPDPEAVPSLQEQVAAARKARNYAKSNPRERYRGPVWRYRLRFAKLGAEALTSHLDLVRSLPRIFRRAGLPLRYSDGFHQHPVVTFSPALSLGSRSAGELMDVDLLQWLTPAQLLERLHAAAPEGLRFLEARLLPHGAAPLGRAIEAAHYAIALRPGPDHPKMDDDVSRERCRAEVEAALWRFLAASHWPGQVERKGKRRDIDLRAPVRELGLDASGRVHVVVSVGQELAPRAAEILGAALAALGWFAPVEAVDIERIDLLLRADPAADEAVHADVVATDDAVATDDEASATPAGGEDEANKARHAALSAPLVAAGAEIPTFFAG